MSLDVAINVARQSLLASQYQIALSGRNVAAAGDPDRSRAAATLATTIDGGVRVASVRRAEDLAVFNRMITATAATAERDAVLTQLEVIAETVGDPENGTSVGALIGDLQSALADYSNAPDDPLFGRSVVERARDVTDALRRVSNDLLLAREEADRNMAESVDEVNRLLGEFDEANRAVVIATISGNDATMHLDRRDAIVSDLSAHLGITTLRRENDDLALFTEGGVTLFDRQARPVSFERTAVYTSGTIGGEVSVDGVIVTGSGAPMPSTTGKIVGHALVRDTVVPTYQLQMDEIARELTDIFEDGIGSLFVNNGGPDYAGSIEIAPDVDPSQGGAVENLRDGTGNASGFAAYPDRLLALGAQMSAATAFDPNAELIDSGSILDFATQSAGWLEGLRMSVQIDADTEAAILLQASDALSRATGVNLDDEYARQLMLERSFNASSRLIGMIDEMFDTLLRIV
ncbi:flagellar hook-associated protein FlgK [Acuticoccus sp. MNP-M23]|uniref:flagellar hook-associated protein FlgK n=1 Tax=Acuticoccus sp. MNP-M23 TaxID=3072793 RepID=UPI002815AC59|nr:flagellar hook-associated protein FlgK [Acuticoccus sp. MNP-M23]WMS41809.1 flagellar hook-associated protein FlgK [Acuticoccus sp. MNP-M23]